MSARHFLNPRSTIAVLLGAEDWSLSHLPRSRSFTRSSKGLFQYLIDSSGMQIDPDRLLDYFDHSTPAAEQLVNLRRSLELKIADAREQGDQISDILVHYVGHGQTDDASNLALLVRSSVKGMETETGIKTVELARTLRIAAPHQRRVIVLDCCFSEAAVTAFYGMGALDEAVMAMASKPFDEEIPGRGTVLFCSSPVGQISIGKPDAPRTLFTGAVLEVLSTGVAGWPAQISMADLRDAAYDVMVRSFGGNAPRPVLHQPNASLGDLTRIPIFRNPAHQKAKEKVRRKVDSAAQRKAEEATRRGAEDMARRQAVEEAARQAKAEAAHKETEETARREAEDTANRQAKETTGQAEAETAHNETGEPTRREAEVAAGKQVEETAQWAAAEVQLEAQLEAQLRSVFDLGNIDLLQWEAAAQQEQEIAPRPLDHMTRSLIEATAPQLKDGASDRRERFEKPWQDDDGAWWRHLWEKKLWKHLNELILNGVAEDGIISKSHDKWVLIVAAALSLSTISIWYMKENKEPQKLSASQINVLSIKPIYLPKDIIMYHKVEIMNVAYTLENSNLDMSFEIRMLQYKSLECNVVLLQGNDLLKAKLSFNLPSGDHRVFTRTSRFDDHALATTTRLECLSPFDSGLITSNEVEVR